MLILSNRSFAQGVCLSRSISAPGLAEGVAARGSLPGALPVIPSD